LRDIRAQAASWMARYTAQAIEQQEGYVALWRGGVRIDFRTAYACRDSRCAPPEVRLAPSPAAPPRHRRAA
jgi:hypothetical protein